MNKRKIFAFILSLTLIAGSFSACGNASTPGEKNDDELTKAPDSIELIDDDQKHSAEDVTAITGATDINGKVTDKVGITDKSGHKIYSTGQKDSAGMVIYTTGKKDSNGDILYTKNNIDSFGHQIYYTGKYDNGQLVLTPSQEKPDYTTNDNPTTVVSSTTTTVGADTNSKFVITDATCEFTKYFGGSGLDTMRSVDGTSDGGFVGVGNSQSFSGDYQGSSKEWGGLHSCIVKYDKDGTVEWKYIIGGDNGVTLKDVAELKDGTVIAVGETSSTDIDAKLNAKNLSSIIIRMNKKGELMWMYSFPNDGKSDGDYLSCVDATPDGGFVVGGKATSDSGFFAETKGIKAFLFKFDKNCNVKWRKVLSGSKSNNFAAVDVNSSGEIFATCVTASTDNDFSAIKFSSAATLNSIVMKFSKNGDLKWSDYLQGSGNSEYNAIAATDDGGCVVGGNFSILRKADGIYSTNYGKSDGYVIRYNSNGNVRWARVVGGSDNDEIFGITAIDGGYAVVGRTRSENGDFQGIKAGGETDGYAIYLNEKGERTVTVRLDGSRGDTALGVCTLEDGAIIVAGATMSKDNAFSGSNASNQYMGYVSKYVAEKTKNK